MSATQETPSAVIDPAAGLARRVRLEPYGVDVGPVGHLARERQRLAELSWETFEVDQLGATIGGEVRGLDLTRPLADEVVAELRQALYDFKVLFFRDQPLNPEQHVAFARRFGELEVHPFLPSNTGEPELVRFEKHAKVGGYENGWHADVTWRECPSMGAILHAAKVPAVGGDTLFADMYAAWEGLDEAARTRVRDLTAVHDYATVFGRGIKEADREEMRKKFPAVEHPVVCTHDGSGRDVLFVNRFFTDHIVGVDRDESYEIIDLLSRQAEYPEYQCRFRWAEHSVAFWDNRAVQHYAASDYWPDIRVMERASVVGARPHR